MASPGLIGHAVRDWDAAVAGLLGARVIQNWIGLAWTDTMNAIQSWQPLIAGLVGASVLAWTVWWTLTLEKRRREAEERAFRVALGTEVRQLAASALNSYLELANSQARIGNGQQVRSAWVASRCRNADPTVYSRNADKVGSLGEEAAFSVVYFYGQLSVLASSVDNVWASRDTNSIATASQVREVMGALLGATKAAVQALPAFESSAWAEQDAQFKGKVREAESEFSKTGQKDGGN